MVSGFDELPKSFGVYIFKDSKNKILYVGKAINLKIRVSSYFNKSILEPKTAALVRKINRIDHIKVENELEALILEADLIKRYKPPYNISLKDDKFYSYINITSIIKEIVGETASLKTIKITRKKDNNKSLYFGPYPKTSSIHIILRSLRKIFPYMDCSNIKFSRQERLKRPCIYGQIGLCKAPCINKKMIITNNKNVDNISSYLSGKKKALFNKMNREMIQLANNEEFEKAAVIRDQIQSYQYLTQNIKDSTEYTANPNLMKTEAETGINELIDVLNTSGFLFDNNISIDKFRIETYDISNFQGSFSVGSMVVLEGGIPVKSEYRKFKIKSKKTPDDFLMMSEILTRRFSSKDKAFKKLPDLIVIDGGKGQLSATTKILNDLNIDIPVIGLAKREEQIVIKKEEEFTTVSLPIKRSKALRVLIKGRDEAHRFAITYYRKLHLKSLIQSK